MLANLLVVLPVFALILTGWIARRSGALGPAATREVNRLVVYLALPALLFDIMANASLEQVWQPRFILAFALGCALVFCLTLWLRIHQGARLADAAIDGLNASYANTGFVGFPLVLALIGESGMGPTLVATILTACVLFAIAIILIEATRQSGARRRDIVRKTLFSLARNPLLVAPVAGAVVLLSGWTLPTQVNAFLSLLGGAASPCALIALGLFLAGTAPQASAPQARTASMLIGMKLVAQPAATWVIAGPLLGLPAVATHTAVLLAALPTGTGPFMIAELYQREALLTSRVVLVTTALSVATLPLVLALVGS
ncbi:Auxin Efflux Carrier [plant metagenome]|uniref:Auxin Efflux Carrier n=1 Tax=plant metagenome TaxID=1297885 RepID=A0A484P6L1_9ZZZZ